MPVAGLEQSSFGVEWNIERRSGDELFVIHIAGVHPRRAAVQTSSGGRRHAHAPEEWPQRYPDARRKQADHSLTIEWNDLRPAVWKIVGKKAAPGSETVA